MDRNFRKGGNDGAGASLSREAWLFAQDLLGKRPSPDLAAADVRARRERLEWLADISPKHAGELRKLQSAEAEARHEREQLEWLAKISPEHEAKLRRLLGEEAEARAANEHAERLNGAAAIAQEGQWDPAKHPRLGGSPNAGWWATTGVSDGELNRPGTTSQPNGVTHFGATPAMLELANAWWKTNIVLQRTRRDIESLSARIASEQAKLSSRDGHSNVHAQNLAKAQRDLEHANALVRQFEKQLRDLEQEYHVSGYDEVPHRTWTPGETLVGGRGIEEVGYAVHMAGSPAGLQPTGIELDVALTAASIFQLGRSALKKAASAARKNIAGQPAALKPYGGAGGGHHIPAKSAFTGAEGYNANAALAIPRDELSRLGVVHHTVTGAQRTLYRAFAKTGQQLTWDAVERIEAEALVRGGLNSDVARATVKEAITALKKAGISGPTRIPWGN